MAADSEFKNEIRAKMSVWERHMQSILLAITLSTVAFSAKFMWDMNSRMTEVLTRLDIMQQSQADFRNITAGLATNFVPRTEFNYVMERMRALEAQIQRNNSK